MIRSSWISIASGLVAFFLSSMLVDHGTGRLNGPGLTIDESFNIQQGVYLTDALAQHGPLIFSPAVAKSVFGSRNYLPDHPPLGRICLGVAHELTSWLITGSELTAYNVPAARLGSCFTFAVTVLLLTEFCRRRFGIASGICVGILMICTPSLLGHARLAALESATNLAWVAALLPLMAWWTDSRPPSAWRASFSGVLWGLLLLTKVQGILLPPIVFLWAVWQYRAHCVKPLICWSICGAILFFAAWPWLWLDPMHNLAEYLGRAAERPTLYCWYFGERYADKQVPWHYPFIMTLFTLPVGIALCLLARFRVRPPDSTDQLLLLSIAIPLTVFALPGTPVYDGNRLFLVVFPAIAVFAARAFGQLDAANDDRNGKSSETYRRRMSRWKAAVLGLLVIQPFGSPFFSPYAISQYSPLIGGSDGAEWLGMESSYWSDGLNGQFWEQVPENSTVFVAPVSHQFQLQDIMSLVPVVQQRNIKLVPYAYDPEQQKGLLLLVHRLADLRPELRKVPSDASVVAEVRLNHVVLARLIDTARSAPHGPAPAAADP
ncbi:MAG: glycosyltransferase family 39 protein [Planctomycetaceae bacterium]